MFISGILLAAGESTRMGDLKQLLLFKEHPLVEYILLEFLNSNLNEVILVLGHEYQKILNSLAASSFKLKITLNRQFEKGLSSSIITGLNSINSQSQAVMLALGDILVNENLINKLLENYKINFPQKEILVPYFKRKRGHPVIFSKKYFSLLKKIKGDQGAKIILKKHPRDILKINIDSANISNDLDTPRDYQKLIN